MALRVIGCMLIGYLLGNLNGAILISRWFHHDDVRNKGSGNAGLTNYFRNYGSIETLIVLAIDVGKTILACFLGGWILGAYDPAMQQTGNMICGAMAVIGHVFPVLFQFRGGKGILTCATLAGFMDWRALAICLGVFLIVVLISRYVSLGSVLGCTLYPFLFLWRFPENWAVVVMAFAVSGLAILMHKSNLVRVFKGEESKLTFHKKVKP